MANLSEEDKIQALAAKVKATILISAKDAKEFKLRKVVSEINKRQP